MTKDSKSYRALLADMAEKGKGYYCGDPVGKCLKHASIRDGEFKKDIHLCLMDSGTYKAFLRREKIGGNFSEARAISGQLIWKDKMRPVPVDAPPYPIFLDAKSGVFRDPSDGAFGCASDVQSCFFVQEESGELEPFRLNLKDSLPHYSAEQDIDHTRSQLEKVDETTRTTLIEARRGQGKYRSDLITVWGKCAVTQCAQVELLRASHIKPWRDASNEERLDKFNGLLLVPNLDAAFDRGLISFRDDGCILISNALTTDSCNALDISKSMKLVHVYQENYRYLTTHRKQHGFQ